MYPNLSTDIMSALDVRLGPAEYKPLVGDYHKKTRSSILLDKKFASLQQQPMPRCLRIIATLDDDQGECLKEERKGDIGILRWDCVEQYLGSIPRAMFESRSVL